MLDCPRSEVRYFSSEEFVKNPNSINADVEVFNSKTASSSPGTYDFSPLLVVYSKSIKDCCRYFASSRLLSLEGLYQVSTPKTSLESEL